MLKRRKLVGESDMANAQTDEPTLQKPLRLWPGVVIVILQLLVRLGAPIVVTGNVGEIIGALGGTGFGLAIIVWWAFFSRAPRSGRWGAVVLIIVALVAMSYINHESMGPHWFMWYPIPVLSLAFVVWAVASRSLADHRGAWPWSQPSCSRVVCGRSFGPRA